MDTTRITPKRMPCALCTELAHYCEPVCPSCLSDRTMRTAHYNRLCKLTVDLVHWAYDHAGTWQDNSDGEVAFELLLDRASDLVFKEMIDE